MIYIFSSILFYLLNFLFIKIWRKKKLNTPKGAGIILIINFFYFGLNFNYSIISLSLLIFLSLIYFLDDLFSINFKWRLLIQIITPILIFYSITNSTNFWILITCTSAFFILINTLNFQDGEDLNISVLLVIIFSIFYLFSSNLIIQKISLLCLIFFSVFIIFNVKKKKFIFWWLRMLCRFNFNFNFFVDRFWKSNCDKKFFICNYISSNRCLLCSNL